MPFPIGAGIVVTSLRKEGRIVEIGRSGRYRVVVGGMSVWCRESDLASVSLARKQARRERAAPSAEAAGRDRPAASEPSARELRELGSLDLHGLTVPEALQALQERMDRAIRAGLVRIEVIHGISGGRLRAAVLGYLAGVGGVARVVPDSRNAGVTWIYF